MKPESQSKKENKPSGDRTRGLFRRPVPDETPAFERRRMAEPYEFPAIRNTVWADDRSANEETPGRLHRAVRRMFRIAKSGDRYVSLVRF